MLKNSRRGRPAVLATLVVAGLLGVVAGTAQAFDPAVEADNFSKIEERQTIYNTPEYQAQLRTISAENRLEATTMQAADPERNFMAQLCATGEDGCAGDTRLYDWEAGGHGLVQKVLFTARNGATISGRVWATRAGPPKRPGVVITNGSVQAPERLYWFIAQTLAKAGYVVLTTDPQGQGQSDSQGESPDENEGFPAQSDTRPFFDGTVDALNFFFSTPDQPYEPVPSCDSGTSHAPKQDRRVAAGLNAAYNPFFRLLDSTRVGIAGHSLGAAGVSFVGQKDPRVKAIVAWDNLGAPSTSTPCSSDPDSHTPAPITKPALGMSADYGLTPQPNTSDPDPLGKSTRSIAYSSAGVDTGEIVIRGGTHYEFSFIPNPAFGGTLRGADMVAWYTTAWFDKYIKGDPTADLDLLTERWRSDAQSAAIDPNGDPNMFSFYYRSRLDIGLSGGGRFLCEDLRTGCSGMVTGDRWPGDYSYLAVATSPDPRGYARPRAASPTTVHLVPAFGECTSGNGSHGAPLAAPSCSPATASSNRLTIGTADANGKPAGATGSLMLKTTGESPINPANGDQADVDIMATFTDVRNKADLSDYTGELRAVLGLRVTDVYNGAALDESATVADTPLAFAIPCAATPGSAGATCAVSTSADAVIGEIAREGQRAVWQLSQMQIFDGGADGDADTAGDNTLFAVQGTFAP